MFPINTDTIKIITELFDIKIRKYLDMFLFLCLLYVYNKNGINTKNRAMLLLKHSP